MSLDDGYVEGSTTQHRGLASWHHGMYCVAHSGVIIVINHSQQGTGTKEVTALIFSHRLLGRIIGQILFFSLQFGASHESRVLG